MAEISAQCYHFKHQISIIDDYGLIFPNSIMHWVPQKEAVPAITPAFIKQYNIINDIKLQTDATANGIILNSQWKQRKSVNDFKMLIKSQFLSYHGISLYHHHSAILDYTRSNPMTFHLNPLNYNCMLVHVVNMLMITENPTILSKLLSIHDLSSWWLLSFCFHFILSFNLANRLKPIHYSYHREKSTGADRCCK